MLSMLSNPFTHTVLADTMLSRILEVIVNIPYIVDGFIVIFLLFAFSVGAMRGIWRALWRFIFVVGVLATVWFALLDQLTLFVANDLLTMINTTINISFDGGTTTTTITSIGDLVRAFAESPYVDGASQLKDAAYLDAFVLSFCRSLGWLAVVLVTHFVTWIISGILYVIMMIIPKRVRKVKLALLGGVLGLVQGALLIIMMMVPAKGLFPAFEFLANAGDVPFVMIPQWMADALLRFDPARTYLGALAWGFIPADIANTLTTTLFSFTANSTNYSFDTAFTAFITETSGYGQAPLNPLVSLVRAIV